MNQPFDESNVAIDDARLHVLDGIFAQGGTRWEEVDAVETRSCLAQRLRRDDQARGDCAAQKVSFSRDDIEGRSRAESDYDGWTSVEMMSCQRISNAIRANFPGIVYQQFDAEVQGVVQDNILFFAVAQGKILKNGCKRRHNAGENDVVDMREGVAGVAQQVAQHHSIFVGGSLACRGDDPAVLRLSAVIHPKLDIGVTDIDGK